MLVFVFGSILGAFCGFLLWSVCVWIAQPESTRQDLSRPRQSYSKQGYSKPRIAAKKREAVRGV